MTKELFLCKVDEIANEQPSYEKCHDGSDGQCDCIGLIIGAIRRAGGSWKGTHGSNYAARNEMNFLSEFASQDECNVGDIVYKAYKPGESGYALPSKYLSGSDKNDYYHVGVVTSDKPFTVTHMTTPTIKRDTKVGKWRYRGTLKKIDGGEQPVMESILVYGGVLTSPINMRSGKASSYDIVTKIPQNSICELVERGNDWSKVKYGGFTGYIKTEFVHTADQIAESVNVPVEAIRKLIDILTGWIGEGIK